MIPAVITPQVKQTQCPVCQTMFDTKPGKKYCTNACRVKHWKEENYIQLYDKDGRWIGQMKLIKVENGN